MRVYLLPILYTLFVWWFSTGAILYLDGLPRRTFKWSMLAATVLLAIALIGLVVTSNDTRTTGAYLAFTCSVMVWGWQEMAFLMGFLTGPRRTPCPFGAQGWPRFKYALQAMLHHELTLIVLGFAVLAATWGGANQMGLWTFVILWIMRQSAKLNVFLGVRNLSEDFLPEHLRYLQTYFARKSMNPLFPVSVTISTILATLVWQGALHATATDFEATGLTFLGALLSLAILEHWFMVLPIPAQQLWNWGLKSRKVDAAAAIEVRSL
jgi:putative photosynthetic complex assembly protein 2